MREPFMERMFAIIGRQVGRRPWIFILLSIISVVLFGSGFTKLESENRPEKLWVPRGAKALDQMDYVKETWPSAQRFNLWIAMCREPGCNMLDADVLRRVQQKHKEILQIVVDGDAIVAEMDELNPDATDRVWAIYNGTYSFDPTNPSLDAGDVAATAQQKCFAYGPHCTQKSVLAMFPGGVSSSLTTDQVLEAVNEWDQQLPPPPFTARSVVQVRDKSGMVMPVDHADYLFGYYVLASSEVLMPSNARVELLADEWEKQALCVFGHPTAESAERKKDDGAEDPKCAENKDDQIKFVMLFGRSFGDSFGAAIKGDISKLGIAYMLILVYMVFMISSYDSVHAMVGMSLVSILIVGFSYGCAMGLGGIFGLMNNSLNGNIPFLLLGLGVDDAFVLVSEFRRATELNPTGSVEDRISAAMKHGGMSILITSATDALAFLVGAMTVLPALSWFCQFAGLGVIFCFIFQITVFMPCLAINARRAEANRFDILCCLKSSVAHERSEPLGHCCCCFRLRLKGSRLKKFLQEKWGAVITRGPGLYATIACFTALFAVGIAGSSLIYQDFEIEWFIPDGTPVKEFLNVNEAVFETGQSVTVYTPDVDYYAHQSELRALQKYMASSPYVDNTIGVKDWHASFTDWCIADDNDGSRCPGSHTSVVEDGSSGSEIQEEEFIFTVEPDFYSSLKRWAQQPMSESFRSSLIWVHAACNERDMAAFSSTCDETQGLQAGRISATMNATHLKNGRDRYQTMIALREEIAEIMPSAFPYSPSFVYWEEVGIVGGELLQNLLICGTVIVVMIVAMVPKPRIAATVIFCILISIVDVVGLLYFWGVTINGVSTIYILIGVGLVVDYSAHIAHIFQLENGSGQERAVAALGRIGPSVFNAIFSTFLAVIVIGFSVSFVFITFFKAFFLVTVVGGAHGIWLLPALLSLLGGGSDETSSAMKSASINPVGEKEAAKGLTAHTESATQGAISDHQA